MAVINYERRTTTYAMETIGPIRRDRAAINHIRYRAIDSSRHRLRQHFKLTITEVIVVTYSMLKTLQHINRMFEPERHNYD